MINVVSVILDERKTRITRSCFDENNEYNGKRSFFKRNLPGDGVLFFFFLFLFLRHTVFHSFHKYPANKSSFPTHHAANLVNFCKRLPNVYEIFVRHHCTTRAIHPTYNTLMRVYYTDGTAHSLSTQSHIW